MAQVVEQTGKVPGVVGFLCKGGHTIGWILFFFVADDGALQFFIEAH